MPHKFAAHLVRSDRINPQTYDWYVLGTDDECVIRQGPNGPTISMPPIQSAEDREHLIRLLTGPHNVRQSQRGKPGPRKHKWGD